MTAAQITRCEIPPSMIDFYKICEDIWAQIFKGKFKDINPSNLANPKLKYLVQRFIRDFQSNSKYFEPTIDKFRDEYNCI